MLMIDHVVDDDYLNVDVQNNHHKYDYYIDYYHYYYYYYYVVVHIFFVDHFVDNYL